MVIAQTFQDNATLAASSTIPWQGLKGMRTDWASFVDIMHQIRADEFATQTNRPAQCEAICDSSALS